MKMKKMTCSCGLLILITLLLFAVGCSSKAAAIAPAMEPKKTQEQVTFNMISFLPKNNALTAVIPKWVERVEESTEGRVQINWKGGSEIVPALEQIDAVRNGVVDLSFNVAGYYQNLAPELTAFSLSEFTPSEERQNGFYNYMADRHQKIGVIYLGRWLGNEPFYLWLNKPITNLEDLKGRRLRTQTLYDRFMKELGIVPVSVNASEVYTALTSNLVQGFGWPMLGARESGWTEKTNYVIDQPFYNQNGTIIVNPKSWEKLSPDLQNKVMEATVLFESDMMTYFQAVNEKERVALQEQGVNFIKLSQEDISRYVKTAYDVEWKNLQTLVPDQVPELERIARKK